MRTGIGTAATAIVLGIVISLAPSRVHAQSATVNVAVTILPAVESNELPVRMRAAADGLRVEHAVKLSGSEMLRSVRMEQPKLPADRSRPVNVVQVIAANS
ncbi:MAG TPA: hypothetical protein VF035_10305 [Longimicrobiales bacterium]